MIKQPLFKAVMIMVLLLSSFAYAKAEGEIPSGPFAGDPVQPFMLRYALRDPDGSKIVRLTVELVNTDRSEQPLPLDFESSGGAAIGHSYLDVTFAREGAQITLVHNVSGEHERNDLWYFRNAWILAYNAELDTYHYEFFMPSNEGPSRLDCPPDCDGDWILS